MSDASPPICVTPVDVFPPAAPAGLAAVPSEGGISLIWEPNAELDLGGYLVLRREAGDATLRQLTDRPIAEARYRDTDVKAGTRYIYSVAARRYTGAAAQYQRAVGARGRNGSLAGSR